MITSEKVGRLPRILELGPKYVDAIVQPRQGSRGSATLSTRRYGAVSVLRSKDGTMLGALGRVVEPINKTKRSVNWVRRSSQPSEPLPHRLHGACRPCSAHVMSLEVSLPAHGRTSRTCHSLRDRTATKAAPWVVRSPRAASHGARSLANGSQGGKKIAPDTCSTRSWADRTRPRSWVARLNVAARHSFAPSHPRTRRRAAQEFHLPKSPMMRLPPGLSTRAISRTAPSVS